MRDMKIRKMVLAALMAALTYVATMVVPVSYTHLDVYKRQRIHWTITREGAWNMDESYAIRRYEQAAALLPLRWQQQARQLAPGQMALAEELRLRAGRPMTVLLPEGEVVPGRSDLPPTVTQSDLEQLCDAVTDYSRYAAGETLSRGYLTARGGFRVGVCGTAVLRDGINTCLLYTSRCV